MQPLSPTKIIQTLHQLLDIDRNLHGKAYLKALAHNISRVFGSSHLIIGKALNGSLTSVETEIFMVNGHQKENFVYDLHGTPCSTVLGDERVCFFGHSVAKRFPEDVFLADESIESYIGVPIFGYDNQLYGLLAVLDTEVYKHREMYIALMDLLSNRIGAELQRIHIENDLREKVHVHTLALERKNRELQETIQELQHLKDNVEAQSQIDFLTQAYNRRAFFDLAESRIQLANEQDKSMAVLFVDIDHFKKVNDEHGHAVGDVILREAATVIKRSLRTSDILCRFGGEEFVVLLAGATQSSAAKMAERVIRAFRHKSILVSNQTCAVTVSIGLASSQGAIDLQKLIQQADTALYEAKAGGRDQYRIFESGSSTGSTGSTTSQTTPQTSLA